MGKKISSLLFISRESVLITRPPPWRTVYPLLLAVHLWEKDQAGYYFFFLPSFHGEHRGSVFRGVLGGCIPIFEEDDVKGFELDTGCLCP